MDATSLGIVSTSLTTAIEIAKAIMVTRDGTILAAKTSQLNDALLQTQQALLSHNAAMFELQQKYFETSEELRKLKEAIAENSRHPLVDLGLGVFAYRVDVAPEQSGSNAPPSPQASHYLCQPCLDIGRKSVLQVGTHMAICSVCKRNAQIKTRDMPAAGRFASGTPRW